MSEIKLFEIKEQVQELVSSEVILEKELQNLIEKNMEKFFGVRFLKSEYAITNGRMDSIGIDENNSPVIFEYKKGVNENVINQGLFYLDWLLNHKADFKLLVLEKMGKEVADVIDWSVIFGRRCTLRSKSFRKKGMGKCQWFTYILSGTQQGNSKTL